MSGRNGSFRVYSTIILAWGPAVQASPLKLRGDGHWNKVVDRLPSRDPLTNVARRDRILLDLEDPDVPRRHRPTWARGNRDRDPAEDLVRLLPRVEDGPLVGADDQHGVLEPLVAQEVDRVGMPVEPDLCAGHVPKRQPRQLEPGRSVKHGGLVPRVLGHKDEHAVCAELPLRPLRKRDVAEMRRVEGAAENRRRQRITVSSPISTSAPALAPTAFKASFSASP
jgi:hypothetical protein